MKERGGGKLKRGKMIEDLKKLIEKGESKNLEFKESLSLKNEIGETVSAFSNTNNGVILTGVSDLGEIKGVEVGKKTIEQLANFIKQNTDNFIYPQIDVEAVRVDENNLIISNLENEREVIVNSSEESQSKESKRSHNVVTDTNIINNKRIKDKNIIVIRVNENDEKPVFFRGNAYKRVGRSNHKMSASEIRKMAKGSSKSYWDKQVCEGAKLSDIDKEKVKWFTKEYKKISKSEILSSPKNLLKVLGCIKKNKLTNAGVLLFSKNPQKFFHNALISIARYKENMVGTEKLDYKEFSGNLFNQIDKADEYIKNHIAMMSRLHPFKVQREDIPEYPFFSIRELIVNAIAHRDYAEQRSKIIIKMFNDRIEYYNPGGLPGKITPKNIINMQKSRNPSIVKILNKLKYIEELGEGWDRIIEEYKTHPLKPEKPEIKDFEDAILVIICKASLDFLERFKDKLNERQIKLVEYLKTHDFIKSDAYAEMFEITDRQARADLSELVSLSLLIKEGKARLIKYRLYPEISGNIRK